MPLRPRAFRLVTGLLLVLGATHALAMSIGEARVDSALGEPLAARIPVKLDESVLPQSHCFELAAVSRMQPALAGARVSLVTRGSGHELLITTPAPVHEPVLDLSVKSVGCGVPLQRDYVIFLSPRALAPPSEATAAPATKPPPPAVSAAPAPLATNEGVAAAKPARPALRAQKKPRAPAAPRPPQRSRYSLKLDYSLNSLARLGERAARSGQTLARGKGLSDAEKAAIAARPRDADSTPNPLATTPADRGVTPPAAKVQQPRADNTPMLTLSPPPDVGQASTATEIGGRGGAPGAAGKAEPGVGSGSASGAATGPPPAGSTLHGMPGHRVATPSFWQVLAPYNLLFIGLLLLFAAAIALWLKGRGPASRLRGRTDILFESMPPAEGAGQALPRTRPEAAPTQEPASAKKTSPSAEAGDLGTLPETNLEQPATVTPPAEIESDVFLDETMPNFDLELAGDITAVPAETPEQVLELAEVMLAFGRDRQAIQALDGFIGANPQMAVDPWLRLLELYQDVGQREKFESVSKQLNKNFNVAVPSWEDFGEQARRAVPEDQSLEAMPHIVARLISLWNTEEALPYLERLLEDNRSGQRSGFALPIVWDILFLRDLLRAQRMMSSKSM